MATSDVQPPVNRRGSTDPQRWFLVVIVGAIPVLIGATVWSLLGHITWPSGLAGALVLGAAFGRPGRVRRRGEPMSGLTGYDYALAAIGATYVGVLTGVNDYLGSI